MLGDEEAGVDTLNFASLALALRGAGSEWASSESSEGGDSSPEGEPISSSSPSLSSLASGRKTSESSSSITLRLFFEPSHQDIHFGGNVSSGFQCHPRRPTTRRN